MNETSITQKVHWNTKHGMERSSEYRTWVNLRSRCHNKNNAAYPNYGGRGIKVCKRWLKFENFYADMGDRPKGMSIDRIDNDGDYKPSNCKWSTVKEQNSNRRNPLPKDKSHLITSCQVCKIKFYAESPSKLNKTKYCGRECWTQSRKLPRIKKIMVKCQSCHKKLHRTPCHIKPTNYCNTECYFNRAKRS